MTFPAVSFTYKKALLGVITPEKRVLVLQYVKTLIDERNADNIILTDDMVSYKGSTSQWQHTTFAIVDGGQFFITEENGISYFIYRYTMQRLIATALIICPIVGVLTQSWFVGSFAFFGLFGMNWLLGRFSQNGLGWTIADGINKAFFEKEKKEKDELNKEMLKSWF